MKFEGKNFGKKAMITGAAVGAFSMGVSEYRGNKVKEGDVARSAEILGHSEYAGGSNERARALFDSYGSMEKNAAVYSVISMVPAQDQLAVLNDLMHRQDSATLRDIFDTLGQRVAPEMKKGLVQDPRFQEYRALVETVDDHEGAGRRAIHELPAFQRLETHASNLLQYSPGFVENVRVDAVTQLLEESTMNPKVFAQFFREKNKREERAVEQQVDLEALLFAITRPKHIEHALSDRDLADMFSVYARNCMSVYDGYRDVDNLEAALDYDITILEQFARLEQAAFNREHEDDDNWHNETAGDIGMVVKQIIVFLRTSSEEEIVLNPKNSARLEVLFDEYGGG